jgi:pimeloyl-ACP methyl ester carboxylesterase
VTATGRGSNLAGLVARYDPDVPSLFAWGRHDTLVPIAFEAHVREALPQARHLELDCGHVPQLQAPAQTHAALLEFLAPE